jgi:tetratricopeptide (TPR) repeat protein
MEGKGRRRAPAPRRIAIVPAFLLALGAAFLGQTVLVQAAYAQPAAQSGAAPAGTAQAQTAAKPAAAASAYQSAAQLYQRGRQLQMAGKETEAAKVFSSSLAAVEKLLASDPSNPDFISLQCWDLFRLERHKDVVTIAQKALQTIKDYRIMETMAESLYFLDRSEEALRHFARYFELAPAGEERMSSAYYYVGECYMRLKKYEHADIAFSTATTMEKSMYYWWYRLGAVKELLGQYKRAYEAYGEALQLNAGFQYAKAGRARVKAKAGL